MYQTCEIFCCKLDQTVLPSEEQIGRNWFGPKLQRRENPANKGSMEKKRVMFKKGYWKKEKDKGY